MRPIIVQTDANVILVRLLQMAYHSLRAPWPPHGEWDSTFSDEPSGQPQVRNANHMIGVQMSEKKPVHFSPRYLKLHQTLECPAAAVKEKLPIAYFDQST